MVTTTGNKLEKLVVELDPSKVQRHSVPLGRNMRLSLNDFAHSLSGENAF